MCKKYVILSSKSVEFAKKFPPANYWGANLIRTLVDLKNKFDKNSHYITASHIEKQKNTNENVIYMLTARDALRLCIQTACKNACEICMCY